MDDPYRTGRASAGSGRSGASARFRGANPLHGDPGAARAEIGVEESDGRSLRGGPRGEDAYRKLIYGVAISATGRRTGLRADPSAAGRTGRYAGLKENQA